jgi:hypothetical protein
MSKPFRWSIAKREQLGTLASAPVRLEPGFVTELRETAARVLALADDADLAFIGRTPENFFDYLSGAFTDVDAAPKLHLVQFSMRAMWPDEATVFRDENMSALADYFEREGVGPAAIAAGERPMALVDMIQYGGTMQSLVLILHELARRARVDWNAVQRRLRIIGLRVRTKNSPNTWRWEQHQDWLSLIPDTGIKNVSASEDFISYITGMQAKVTTSFHLERWQAPEGGAPEPSPEQRDAIAHAAMLYDLGRTRAERQALASQIAQTPQMRQPATRALVLGLKR